MEDDFLNVVNAIARKLTEKGLRLGIAESCTGGYIANIVTDLPGASRFLDVSVVSYSESAKKSVLGVSGSVLRKHGTVSEETAVAMAQGVRKLTGTEVGLAVTGVAGPESVEGRDVGLIFVAVTVHDFVEARGLKLTGDREEIKRTAALEALKFLKRVMEIWL